MVRPTTIVLPIALMAFGVVAFLVLIDYLVSPRVQPSVTNSNVVACTDEAKICPDGSAVGRTGQNCTFAPCPGVNTNTSRPTTNTGGPPEDTNTNTTDIVCAEDVRSCYDGSFVKRVPPECGFSACPDGSVPVPPSPTP